jgi:hypothetical protein
VSNCCLDHPGDLDLARPPWLQIFEGVAEQVSEHLPDRHCVAHRVRDFADRDMSAGMVNRLTERVQGRYDYPANVYPFQSIFLLAGAGKSKQRIDKMLEFRYIRTDIMPRPANAICHDRFQGTGYFWGHRQAGQSLLQLRATELQLVGKSLKVDERRLEIV